ncbi:cupin domain-containing protein [Acidisphaera rubrifaciens]|uniref:HTH araC/xylS-type domain-containing protein n=1 Tax=Acidisphaera rubrifaciens HS-AP3 TaxID=1231350 RepID=A0A0D6P997_9PROT|nr:AraC family transcriptional regulator [Acidisphaera rubrifaciens]GAN78227.1 hypothetical protein Asru_0690_07 [Acidisphaera rubrifaciens HS-AP3]
MASGTDNTFRQLANLLQVRPELQQICLLGAQWAFPHDHAPHGSAPFHIVIQGTCLLDVAGRTPIALSAGDVAVLPHGDQHVTRAYPGAAGTATNLAVRPRAHDHLVVKTNVDRDPDTKLICGRLIFEHAHHNLVLAALPAVVVLQSDNSRDALRAREIVDTIGSELDDDRIAAAAVAASLANALMVVVLRASFEQGRQSPGVLALLQRPQTARAVAAIVGDLRRPWTLDELAAEASASRATLVRQFRRATGGTPLGFLADLRLNVARHRLLATHDPVALISDHVGYQSEAAFSRAYHRRFGLPPGADRKTLSARGVPGSAGRSVADTGGG